MKTKFNQDLILSLKDNYTKSDDVKKIIDDLVHKHQQEYLKNPTFTFTKQMDYKSGHYYITAKSCVLFGIGEMKQVRVSVGRLDKYKNGFEDLEVLEIAKIKLTERVTRLIR